MPILEYESLTSRFIDRAVKCLVSRDSALGHRRQRWRFCELHDARFQITRCCFVQGTDIDFAGDAIPRWLSPVSWVTCLFRPSGRTIVVLRGWWVGLRGGILGWRVWWLVVHLLQTTCVCVESLQLLAIRWSVRTDWVEAWWLFVCKNEKLGWYHIGNGGNSMTKVIRSIDQSAILCIFHNHKRTAVRGYLQWRGGVTTLMHFCSKKAYIMSKIANVLPKWKGSCKKIIEPAFIYLVMSPFYIIVLMIVLFMFNFEF